MIEEFLQLSLFTLGREQVTAINCMDGARYQATALPPWASRIEPRGEYLINIDDHPCVLSPADTPPEEGHQYRHYQIGKQLYAGCFVG